ncbi:MAG: class I SAM-dependent methyltransferase [Phycisphaeraceae bacterium]|nr:class I SAM-dependent methyltransferase [Phycisphaerae bacterium]MBX3391984.1 class I SAM-dependent methyltransferase [Phycisphaeraceae bacterium]HRJ49590.1 class I SAM-dependent methyltransferase [Phycisphaerales bacterium]
MTHDQNARPDAPGRDWTTYYIAVSGKPARETLLEAIGRFERERAGKDDDRNRIALDLGCGEGRDTRALLDAGWRVVAVDPHPEAVARVRRITGGERLDVVQASIEDLASESVDRDASGRFPIPVAVDLVNASFSLPFVPPSRFAVAWTWIRGMIAPGGRFCGQFFGPRDSWSSIPGRSHHDLSAVRAMLDGFAIELLREDEKDGHDAEGNPKHWHVFHVVARRPGESSVITLP